MQDFKHLFIIGAPKAGTSTLAELLRLHPDIYQGASKEPRFFCDFGARRWTGPGSETFVESLTTEEKAYHALFAAAPAGAWRLDASTDYLSNTAARLRLTRLAQTRPVKVICMLRDPVERVISEYRHTLRDLLDDASLIEALSQEEARRKQGWQPLFWHIRRSRYHDDISAYQAAFGDNLMLVDFAELRDQEKLKARVLAFLALAHPPAAEDAAARPPEPGLVRNESYSYRSTRIQRALLNPTLRQTAQHLLPRPVRSWLWHRLDQANRATYQPSNHDLRAIQAALDRDIRLCLADPTIPTASWKLSRHLTSGSDGNAGTQAASAAPDATTRRGA